MLSENASSVMAQITYNVNLSENLIKIDGVPDFSIKLDDPRINVGSLYKAFFKEIKKPTKITLKPSQDLKSNATAYALYVSFEKIITATCEAMNPGLETIINTSNQGVDNNSSNTDEES